MFDQYNQARSYTGDKWGVGRFCHIPRLLEREFSVCNRRDESGRTLRDTSRPRTDLNAHMFKDWEAWHLFVRAGRPGEAGEAPHLEHT